MPFQPGQSGNPRGRPVGSASGRSKALAALDSLLSEQATLDRMQAAFQAEFNKNPVRFFRQIIMPLLPRDTRLAVFNDPGPVQWKSLAETMAEGRTDGKI